jgi:hypothetical protein
MAIRFLNIDFVNILHVPLHRRLETLAVLQWLFSFVYLGLCCFFLFVILLFSPLYFIPLAYAVFYYFDYRTPEHGGRRREWVRNWRIWTYLRDYFPVKLHRTAPLDPAKNYLLGYHPHGLMAFGAFVNFGTNATGVNKVFPGIRTTILTLACQFMFPFHRDYNMALGEFNELHVLPAVSSPHGKSWNRPTFIWHFPGL